MGPSKTSLQTIKGSLRRDHFYLTEEDKCFFIGTYTARQPAAYSKMNKFILNLKKPLTRMGQSDWTYKTQAIKEASSLILSLDAWDKMQKFTWVPAPPSQIESDTAYDDRLLQVLLSLKSKIPLKSDSFDFRELILQKTSRVAAHGSSSRPKSQDLLTNFHIDDTLLLPIPTGLIIFDDVLVTGSTFIAMKSLLTQHYPGIPIFGFFLARNIWDADPDLPQN